MFFDVEHLIQQAVIFPLTLSQNRETVDDSFGIFKGVHNEDAERIVNCFSVLRKCQGKYDCLLYEMLYIKEHKPSLNTQSDSIQAKVFV